MIYIASPFFSEFQKFVKENMKQKVVDYEQFDPASTPTSKEYDEATDTSRKELASKIFQENCEAIKNCEILIFPQYTTDLGTLFEVGYAWSLNKELWRYNYLTDSIKVLHPRAIDYFTQETTVLDVSNIYNAVFLGFLYGSNIPRERINYYLPESMNDNVMLASMFQRVDSKGRPVQITSWRKVD